MLRDPGPVVEGKLWLGHFKEKRESGGEGGGEREKQRRDGATSS